MSLIPSEIIELLSIIAFILAVFSILLQIPRTRKIIYQYWIRLTIKDFIQVLGCKEVGKTTMICFLRRENLPIHHIHTFGAQTFGPVNFDINGKDTQFLCSRRLVDLAGEHVNQWKITIRAENPKGIIYMVDTVNLDAEKKGFELIHSIYDNWLTELMPDKIHLKTILVIVNKADVWSNGNDEMRKQKINEYRTLFNPTVEKFTHDMEIDIQFGWTSLTRIEYFDHNCDVLFQFATSLASKR